MALMLALDRRLKTYIRTVDSEHCWKYYMASKPMGLNSSTLGLFGFGKIGRAVARRARGFGMRVLAVDPHADEQPQNLVLPSQMQKHCCVSPM